MRLTLLTTFFFSFCFHYFSQCVGGTLSISGAGCGCQALCNLTSLGGPNCGAAGVSGNCTAGYIAMQIDITVPAGCSYTVAATMQNRPGGCIASGADGNCQTCDRVKVDMPGGSKIFQIGTGNATITDSYTLAAPLVPGTIRISGGANRADEIITYTITSIGAGAGLCPNCVSSLPIELVAFNAIPVDDFVELTWSTLTEIDNDFFTIQRSRDGSVFEDYHFIDGRENSSTLFNYKVIDSSPLYGRSYYRLKQTDINGESTLSKVVAVMLKEKERISIHPNPVDNEFSIRGKDIENTSIQLFDSFGEEVNLVPLLMNGELKFDTSNLESGNYFLKAVFEENVEIQKIIVQ